MSRELKRWSYFLILAEELHFGRAAQRVGTDEATFGNKIRELEHIVRVTLIDRSNRRSPRLTSAGEALVPEACSLIARHEDTLKIARSVASGFTARLRIGFCEDIPPRPLHRLLSDLRKEAPWLDVDLIRGTCTSIAQDLRGKRLDLGFCLGEFEAGHVLEAIELWNDEARVLLPDGHALALKKKVAVRDFSGFRLVLNHRHCLCGRRARMDDYIRFTRARPALKEVENLEALQGMVAAGYGIGIASSAAVGSSHHYGLITRLLEDEELKYKIFLLRRKDDSSQFTAIAMQLARCVAA